ncbi:MAG: tetratricopeptide repeat protein [Chloroflexi bacterium]|nr:tetratricopeptide repeat protein [Chloroflexota bacterium]
MDKDEKLFNRVLKLMGPHITQETVDFLNKTLTADPGLSGRWLETAMELGYQGNYARADDYFKVLYCIRQGDPGIMHLQVINTWLQGLNKSAAGMCRGLIKRNPGFTAAHLTLANAEYELGHYEPALRSFGVFLKSSPDNVLGWCGKGMALRALGREEEAMDCFGRVLDLNPGCARGYIGTAGHHIACGLYKEALLFLDRALALDPGLAEAWFRKGIALSEIGRFREALTCMDRAAGEGAPALRVIQYKAYLYHMLGQDNAARACLDEWLEAEPANPAAWSGMGGQLLSESRYEEAEHYLRKSLELDNNYAMAWHALGTALEPLGRHGEALTCFDRALELDPQNGEVIADRGKALAALGGK